MHKNPQIRTITNEDQKVWDDYVNQHKNATPYHRYAWMKACETAYSMQAKGLIAIDAEGLCCGIFPLVHFKVPFFTSNLISLPYCDLGYPVADDAEITELLESKALELLNKSKNETLKIRALVSDLEGEEITIEDGAKVSMQMALPSNSEELNKSFKSKLRSQIRKAEKNGLEFEIQSGTVLLDEFFAVYAKNMRDLGSPPHSKKWFEKILQHYANNSIISVVRSDNNAIGAGIVLFNGNKASIPWASTLREYNRLAPNMLLYWSVLSYCSDNGVHTFDFGRSSYGEGTYKFKKQWGAVETPLLWQQFDGKNQILPSDTQAFSSNRNLLKNLWSKLPEKISSALGGQIRRLIDL